MNMNESIKTEAETSFARAYEINNHTIEVVKAAIASGNVGADKVADLIRSVHSAFAETYGAAGGIASTAEALASSVAASLTAPVAAEVALETVAEAAPAEEPRKYVSLFENPYDAVEDEVVKCLIDGVGKKMLKRYVRAKYNLEWEQYLEMFDLPYDYPSVAPKYSDSKKAEAIALGLGSTVPKTPRAERGLQEAQTPRTTSERRRRNRDPQKSGTMTATRAAA
jgi:predicted transcriptional regulator